MLSSNQPVEAGIAAATEESLQLLEIEGVAGVNLSDLGSGLDYFTAAEIKAEVARRIA